MQYAWKQKKLAHILDDDGRSLCQTENVGWKPTSKGLTPPSGRRVCQICRGLAFKREKPEPVRADEVKTAEAAEIIRLKAKIAVLEKDVERLLGQINPNEELERMAAIRDQLSAPE